MTETAAGSFGAGSKMEAGRKEVRTDLKSLVISVTVPSAFVMLVISIWSRLSVQFGTYFMQAFNSLHPHPFTALETDLEWYEHMYGVLFDTLYTAVDVAFFVGVVGLLYNWQARKGEA
jgi:hypothetical protein